MKTIRHILLCLFLVTTIPLLAGPGDHSFVVVIDPGHGGKDPGATTRRSQEKKINLEVALQLGKYITEKHPDVKIVYTRDKDIFIGLKERRDIANKSKANLFISIHVNSIDKNTSASGAEVFAYGAHNTKDQLEVAMKENSVIVFEDNYQQKYQSYDNSPEALAMFTLQQHQNHLESLDFATMVQEKLVKTAKRKDRGVKQAGFHVLRFSTMPGILVELDFISNPEAEKFLTSASGQKAMARSIGEAFSAYKKNYDTRNKVSIREEESVSPKSSEEGRIYKVQILTSGTKLPASSSKFKGHKVDYYQENNIYKYTSGESSDWDEILRIRKSLLKDFKDAFIVTFENGKRVTNK